MSNQPVKRDKDDYNAIQFGELIGKAYKFLKGYDPCYSQRFIEEHSKLIEDKDKLVERKEELGKSKSEIITGAIVANIIAGKRYNADIRKRLIEYLIKEIKKIFVPTAERSDLLEQLESYLSKSSALSTSLTPKESIKNVSLFFRDTAEDACEICMMYLEQDDFEHAKDFFIPLISFYWATISTPAWLKDYDLVVVALRCANALCFMYVRTRRYHTEIEDTMGIYKRIQEQLISNTPEEHFKREEFALEYTKYLWSRELIVIANLATLVLGEIRPRLNLLQSRLEQPREIPVYRRLGYALEGLAGDRENEEYEAIANCRFIKEGISIVNSKDNLKTGFISFNIFYAHLSESAREHWVMSVPISIPLARNTAPLLKLSDIRNLINEERQYKRNRGLAYRTERHASLEQQLLNNGLELDENISTYLANIIYSEFN